jgi:hypothetical protein
MIFRGFSLIELWLIVSWGINKMPQPITGIIDYRNLLGKLARIYSEWDSLDGLITFRAPCKNDEPAESSAAYDACPMEIANNEGEFPRPPPPQFAPCQKREFVSQFEKPETGKEQVNGSVLFP